MEEIHLEKRLIMSSANSTRLPFKTYFNWSTGKDSAFALYKLKQDACFQVDLLLTTVNRDDDHRVSMHGLRRLLLEQQAASIGIPLHIIELPAKPSMEEYQELMARQVEMLVQQGYTRAAFGDIFLEQVRKDRDDKLRPCGILCEFPLWKIDSKELIREFLQLGFRTIVVSCNAAMGECMCGCEIDEDFLQSLPEDIDWCGENGEFHTFCFDGPIFSKPVEFHVGEKSYRENLYKGKTYGMWFVDLVPKEKRM